MSVSNCSATVPVILLARMGPARERLREAVIAAGGELLQEEDPTLLGPDALQAQAATVVLVALEPAIEDALERLDTVLESPHLTLIFDEAELAARREGWEAQRWIRHLSAKLRGHDNVLPPGPEHEPSASPAMPVSADALPVAPAPAPAPAPVAAEAEAEAAAWSPSHEVLADETAVSWPSPAAPLSPWQRSPEPLGEEPADTWQAQRPSSPQVIDPLQDEPASAWSPSVVPPQAAAAPAPELPPLPFAAPVRSAAPVEPPPLPPLPDAPATVAAPAAKDFNSWALVEDDALIVSTTRPQATPQLASFLTTDLSLLEVDDGGAAGSGAVLLLADIGGPDALRRFLGALPASFARPVLVQMRLDGGRYGNLVKQMARVAALPVLLAEPGTVLEAGNVYVLPDAVGIAVGNGVLEFVGDASESVIEVLPAADSAVVMLSGAAPERVEATLALASQGGWVAGQVSEGCYDPAAALRLAEQGMNTGDPVYLANALCERWGG